jgi:hypothetical protein
MHGDGNETLCSFPDKGVKWNSITTKGGEKKEPEKVGEEEFSRT